MNRFLLAVAKHAWYMLVAVVITVLAIFFLALSSAWMTQKVRDVQDWYQDRTPSAAIQLKNWGLQNSTSRSHVNAPCAWANARPVKDVVVAVIDSGIDPSHRDLEGQLWCDPKRSGCTYGWDFVTNQPNPADAHGHGTHVAGIIAAAHDQRSHVAGLATRARIMAIRYYSDANTGSENLKNTVRAINYAVDHGARIINYSGGGPEFSEQEYLALRRAEQQGILVVAAAGNEHQNIDLVENYYYPSSYHLTNIVSVAATDIRNLPVPSSNWGQKRVDLFAPGENIYSTLPGDRFGYMTGTSQATAFVTGIAALIWSTNPSLTAGQVKAIIMGTTDRFPQLESRSVTGGRANACAAVKRAALDTRK